MASIITDGEVRALFTPFVNYDPAYITIVNDGIIQERYLKPFLNGFYNEFIDNSGTYTDIEADLKKAVGYLTAEEVIEQNGQSKTANLGEMASFTQNSKTAEPDKMRAKQIFFIDRAVYLIEKVFQVLIETPADYPGFEEKEVYFTINLERFTGTV